MPSFRSDNENLIFCMEGISNIHAWAGKQLETVGLMKMPVVIKISDRLFCFCCFLVMLHTVIISFQFNVTCNIKRITL